MTKTKTKSKKKFEWMLADITIEQIEACKHHKMDKKNPCQEWCLKSKHSCYGLKPGTKNYAKTVGYFECMCLCYAGLCPEGVIVGWRLVEVPK